MDPAYNGRKRPCKETINISPCINLTSDDKKIIAESFVRDREHSHYFRQCYNQTIIFNRVRYVMLEENAVLERSTVRMTVKVQQIFWGFTSADE